jgi:hypothetical protein
MILTGVQLKAGSAVMFKEVSMRCIDCEHTFTVGNGGVKHCACENETMASRKKADRVESSYVCEVNFFLNVYVFVTV